MILGHLGGKEGSGGRRNDIQALYLNMDDVT